MKAAEYAEKLSTESKWSKVGQSFFFFRKLEIFQQKPQHRRAINFVSKNKLTKKTDVTPKVFFDVTQKYFQTRI